jgi:hypothetical protein
MKPLSAPVYALVSASLAFGAVPLRAVDLQTLVDRSPFSPPAQAADGTGTAEPQGTLEFRGMVTDTEGTSYSIFDTTTNKGRWVRADDANSPVQVKGFDSANNTLEVEQNGKPVKLPLKRAVIQAGQPVSAMVPPMPAPNAAPANPAAANQNRPDGAGDARRLEAVAAEVRRRRALRNSANGTRQGQPAPAATPAPAAPAAPGAVPPPPAP